MAITIESNTETTEELNAGLASLGFEPEEATARSSKPEGTKKEEKPSESTEKLGEKTAEATEGKSEPVTETGKTQEIPPGETEAEKAKNKGGWQRQIDKKTAQVETLREELEEERGDKTRLRDQLAEAKRELEALRGTSATVETEKKDIGPIRPKRPEVPDLASMEYDTEKYEKAMKVYRAAEVKFDDDLDAYHKAMNEKTVKDALEAEKVSKAEERRATEQARVEKEAAERLDAGRKALGTEWDDTYEALPKDAKLALDDSIDAKDYILLDAAHPALLYMFLFKDYLENDSKEGKRIAQLSPKKQVAELARIEDRLFAESKGTKTEEPPKVETKPAQEPPAKPAVKPAKVPDEPIDTLGGGRAIAGTSLTSLYKQADVAATAGDHKEVKRLLNLIETEERKAAGKVA